MPGLNGTFTPCTDNLSATRRCHKGESVFDIFNNKQNRKKGKKFQYEFSIIGVRYEPGGNALSA